MTRKTSISYEKSRLKDIVWQLLLKYHPSCHICKRLFEREDILPSRGSDNLTMHHKDGNHYNNDPDNWSWAHRVCHKSHHSKDNIHFWKQFDDMT